ncbi:MAG: YvcK family protein, partial [Planctomycetes bacterium]|nr:YvcK family protein [Planctomycetota bacterium]
RQITLPLVGTVNLSDVVRVKPVYFIPITGRSPPNATIVNGEIYVFAQGQDKIHPQLLARMIIHESVEEYLQNSHPKLDETQRHELARKAEGVLGAVILGGPDGVLLPYSRSRRSTLSRGILTRDPFLDLLSAGYDVVIVTNQRLPYDAIKQELGIRTRIIDEIPEHLRRNITLFVSSGTVQVKYHEDGREQLHRGFNSRNLIDEEAAALIQAKADEVIEEYWERYEKDKAKYRNRYPAFMFIKPQIFLHTVDGDMYGVSILYWPSRTAGVGTLSSQKDENGEYKEKDERKKAMERLVELITAANPYFFSEYTIREAGVTTLDIRRRGTGKDLAIEGYMAAHQLRPGDVIFFGSLSAFSEDEPLRNVGLENSFINDLYRNTYRERGFIHAGEGLASVAWWLRELSRESNGIQKIANEIKDRPACAYEDHPALKMASFVAAQAKEEPTRVKQLEKLWEIYQQYSLAFTDKPAWAILYQIIYGQDEHLDNALRALIEGFPNVTSVDDYFRIADEIYEEMKDGLDFFEFYSAVDPRAARNLYFLRDKVFRSDMELKHNLAVAQKHTGLPIARLLIGYFQDHYVYRYKGSWRTISQAKHMSLITYIGGGGPAITTLVHALVKRGVNRLTTVVSSSDDGGSSANIMMAFSQTYGFYFIPPGDTAGMMIEMSPDESRIFVLFDTELGGLPAGISTRGRITADVVLPIWQRRVIETERVLRQEINIGRELQCCPDYIMFISGLLTLGEMIDRELVSTGIIELKKMSTANLVLIGAAYDMGVIEFDHPVAEKISLDNLARLLGLTNQQVVPVSYDYERSALVAMTEDGRLVVLQTNITDQGQTNFIKEVVLAHRVGSGVTFDDVEPLEEAPLSNPEAVEVIQHTKRALLLGNGSLFTSLLPNLLYPAVAEAIIGARAKGLPVIYMAKLKTDLETSKMVSAKSRADYSKHLEEILAADLSEEQRRIYTRMQELVGGAAKPYFLHIGAQQNLLQQLEIVRRHVSTTLGREVALNEIISHVIVGDFSEENFACLSVVGMTQEEASTLTVSLEKGEAQISKYIYGVQPFSPEDVRRYEEELGRLGIVGRPLLELQAEMDAEAKGKETQQGHAAGQKIRRTMLSKEMVESFVRIGGTAIREFLGELGKYEGAREESPYKDIAGVENVWAGAREYKERPEEFSDERLVRRGGMEVPRIEVRGLDERSGEAAQVAVIGIPGKYREGPQERMKGIKGVEGLSIKMGGFMTLEVNVAGVSKALAIDYIGRHYEAILRRMGYKGGALIDARRTRSVITADGDGTTYGKPTAERNPELWESASYEALEEYLEVGGLYVLISGNDIELTRQRLLAGKGIREELRGRFIVVANGAANIGYMDKEGKLVEIKGYRRRALGEYREGVEEGLDIIYLGDDEKEKGNDYPAFEKVGFGRAVSVSSKKKEEVPEGLRQNYVGGLEQGVRDVLRVVVERAKANPQAELFDEEGIRATVSRVRELRETEKKAHAAGGREGGETLDAANFSTMLNSRVVERIVELSGRATRRFLKAVNKDEIKPGLLSEKLIAAAKEFDQSPQDFSDEVLTEVTRQDVPRIEIRGKNITGMATQVTIIGIVAQFKEELLRELQQLPVKAIDVSAAGGTGIIDINSRDVNKALVLDYVGKHFHKILVQIGYKADRFDAREAKSLVAADGDRTTYGSNKERKLLSLSEANSQLLRYLQLGGVYLLITGNRKDKVIEKLLRDNEPLLRFTNRLLIAVNGGSILGYLDREGRFLEIEDYRRHAKQTSSDGIVGEVNLVYLGDDHREEGNDYPAFKKVGFNRAITVTATECKNVPEALRINYVGGLVSGTRSVLMALNEQVELAQKEFELNVQTIEAVVLRARELRETEKKFHPAGGEKSLSLSYQGNLTIQGQTGTAILFDPYKIISAKALIPGNRVEFPFIGRKDIWWAIEILITFAKRKTEILGREVEVELPWYPPIQTYGESGLRLSVYFVKVESPPSPDINADVVGDNLYIFARSQETVSIEQLARIFLYMAVVLFYRRANLENEQIHKIAKDAEHLLDYEKVLLIKQIRRKLRFPWLDHKTEEIIKTLIQEGEVEIVANDGHKFKFQLRGTQWITSEDRGGLQAEEKIHHGFVIFIYSQDGQAIGMVGVHDIDIVHGEVSMDTLEPSGYYYVVFPERKMEEEISGTNPDVLEVRSRGFPFGYDHLFNAIAIRDEFRLQYRGLGSALMTMVMTILKFIGIRQFVVGKEASVNAPGFFLKLGFKLQKGAILKFEMAASIPSIMIIRERQRESSGRAVIEENDIGVLLEDLGDNNKFVRRKARHILGIFNIDRKRLVSRYLDLLEASIDKD